MKQADLFDGDGEPGLFADEAAPRLYRADPNKVREKLMRILGEARAASTMPWDEATLSSHRISADELVAARRRSRATAL